MKYLDYVFAILVFSLLACACTVNFYSVRRSQGVTQEIKSDVSLSADSASINLDLQEP